MSRVLGCERFLIEVVVMCNVLVVEGMSNWSGNL